MKPLIFNLSENEQFKAEWDGSITLKRLNFDERYKLSTVLNLTIDDAGKVAFNGDAHEKMVTLVRELKENFLVIDITHKESGEKFSTFDDMAVYGECFPIAIAAAMYCYAGNSLGKK